MEENNMMQEKSAEMSPKNNKKSIAILVGVVVVLALTVGVLAKSFLGGAGANQGKLRALKGTPQEIIHAAMMNTKQQMMSEAEALSEKTGEKVLKDIVNSEAAKFDFEFTLNNAEGLESLGVPVGLLKNAGIIGDLAYSKDGKKFNANLKAKQGELEIVGLNLYKEGSEVALDVPQLFDNPYAVKLDTFMQDLEKSPLYSMLGGTTLNKEEVQQVSDLFSAFGKYMNGIMTMQNDPKYVKKLEELYKQSLKDMDIKENGTKALIIGGKEAQCKVYTTTLTAEQIAKLNKAQVEVLMEFDFVKEFFDVIAKQSGTTREELLKQMDAAQLGDTELELEFWVDDHFIRGGLINLKSTQDEEVAVNIEYGFLGEKYISDKIYAKLSVNENGSESAAFDFTATNNSGENSSVVKSGVILDMTSEGEKVSFAFNSDYDTKAKEDNLNVNFDIDVPTQGKFSIGIKGNKTVNAGSKELSTSIKEIDLKLNDGALSAKLDVLLSFGAKAIKANEIKKDTAREAKYILEMSQEELTAMIQSIQTKLQAFSGGLL